MRHDSSPGPRLPTRFPPLPSRVLEPKMRAEFGQFAAPRPGELTCWTSDSLVVNVGVNVDGNGPIRPALGDLGDPGTVGRAPRQVQIQMSPLKDIGDAGGVPQRDTLSHQSALDSLVR